ncbi:hypothetical protein VNO77_02539 [Canavalia gladiata]|uniref:Uncharacterized protein n=1 Tax=Canavalia gladiata TaxID=3824 RepID=A0AAN9MV91_CANGL
MVLLGQLNLLKLEIAYGSWSCHSLDEEANSYLRDTHNRFAIETLTLPAWNWQGTTNVATSEQPYYMVSTERHATLHEQVIIRDSEGRMSSNVKTFSLLPYALAEKEKPQGDPPPPFCSS